MADEIIDLICTGCVKTKYDNYIVSFLDSKKKKYQLDIHDAIPVDTAIKLNTFYHELHDKDGITTIRVKQRFNGRQPEKLEVEIIDITEIKDGSILTFKDTTTADKFKLKVSKPGSPVGTKSIFDFKKHKMIIQCRPHFHRHYSIENWIFFGQTI